MMAVQACIIAAVDESKQTARRTLKQHGPAPVFFQVKTFFSVTGFQLFGVLFPKNVSSSVNESGNASAGAHTKNNWKGTAKKGSDGGCTLVQKREALFIH